HQASYGGEPGQRRAEREYHGLGPTRIRAPGIGAERTDNGRQTLGGIRRWRAGQQPVWAVTCHQSVEALKSIGCRGIVGSGRGERRDAADCFSHKILRYQEADRLKADVAATHVRAKCDGTAASAVLSYRFESRRATICGSSSYEARYVRKRTYREPRHPTRGRSTKECWLRAAVGRSVGARSRSIRTPPFPSRPGPRPEW